MAQYSIDEFISASAQRDRGQGTFELESPHLLEVKLNGRVWSKVGAMIGYLGNVNFKREGVLEHGIGNLMKKMVSGEGMSLMKMEGNGRIYLADSGKRVHILNLNNDTFFVNGNDVLAMEDSIKWEIKLMRRIAGMVAGGLFNVRVSGTGMVAITTHYEPLTLAVKPGVPVFTDPNATIAWSGSLEPEIVTNFTVGTFLGRGSGEAIQLKFQGNGWVVLQPYEEVYSVESGS
ncbi:AIM24 family protein [Leptolyngbya sp. AN03gr2]|uniref:AIM24 family protein n=1 Tax=unclassified Leptolyngbya TaxID=2650499 RepID=UPI003D31405C